MSFVKTTVRIDVPSTDRNEFPLLREDSLLIRAEDTGDVFILATNPLEFRTFQIGRVQSFFSSPEGKVLAVSRNGHLLRYRVENGNLIALEPPPEGMRTLSDLLAEAVNLAENSDLLDEDFEPGKIVFYDGNMLVFRLNSRNKRANLFVDFADETFTLGREEYISPYNINYRVRNRVPESQSMEYNIDGEIVSLGFNHNVPGAQDLTEEMAEAILNLDPEEIPVQALGQTTLDIFEGDENGVFFDDDEGEKFVVRYGNGEEFPLENPDAEETLYHLTPHHVLLSYHEIWGFDNQTTWAIDVCHRE
jgi:hypothetical protein